MTRAKLSAAAAAFALLLGACSGTPDAAVTAAPSPTAEEMIFSDAVTLLDASDMFTKRDSRAEFDEQDSAVITFGDEISCSRPELIALDGQTVTIKSGGTYILRGTLTNGSVVIDALNTDKIQLVLDGVEIYSSDSAAIYVKQADKVFITLSERSENTLSSGEFKSDDGKVDAVIYSKDDLSFNGSGALRIKSPAGNGISTKDDLVFTGGSYTVTAKGHALEATDSVRISGGSFDLTAARDGIHSENNKDNTHGYVYISDGSFTINSDGDAVSASACIQLDGGSFNLTCGGGSTAVHSTGREYEWDKQPKDDSSKASAKGLKAASGIAVNGGRLIIDSADDAVHASSDVFITGGELTLSSGDDAVHAGNLLRISGGSTEVLKSYEGLEGTKVSVSGGSVKLSASDDGINAAGGRDASGLGGFENFSGNPGFTGTSDCEIIISGGSVHINSAGDGIDSNGSVSVTGGEVLIDGPVSERDSALDYELSADISGGTFVALGSAGMAQNFGTASQGSMLISPGAQKSGSTLAVTDGSGNVLVRFTAAKDFASAVVSCSAFRQGETYTVTCGDYTSKVTLDSLIYTEGGMSGMGIRPGGPPPDGQTPPSPPQTGK